MKNPTSCLGSIRRGQPQRTWTICELVEAGCGLGQQSPALVLLGHPALACLLQSMRQHSVPLIAKHHRETPCRQFLERQGRMEGGFSFKVDFVQRSSGFYPALRRVTSVPVACLRGEARGVGQRRTLFLRPHALSIVLSPQLPFLQSLSPAFI